LEAIGEGEPEVGDIGFGGFAALAGPLRHAAWPPRFKPDTVARYDGTSDPVEFLQQYAASVRAAGGDGHVMANWFMMATKGKPRRWLCGLPPRSISSWRDLCERFLDKHASLGPEPGGAWAYAALGGPVPRSMKMGQGGSRIVPPLPSPEETESLIYTRSKE
jgi:hypothetical protein